MDIGSSCNVEHLDRLKIWILINSSSDVSSSWILKQFDKSNFWRACKLPIVVGNSCNPLHHDMFQYSRTFN